MKEIFDILDDNGKIIGSATRDECHGGTFLLHGVVHVLVFTSAGDLIMQKRSHTKDIQPGKWDTSVGGHINSSESLDDALNRETKEELGITGAAFELLYRYVMTSNIERELVTTFRCTWDGEIFFPTEEIDSVRTFSPKEIQEKLGTGMFTPNFEDEWSRYNEWLKKNPDR